MDGKKMAKVLLLMMVFDLLLFSATDAKPWWRRRRRSSRRRRHCDSTRPSGVLWANRWHEYFRFTCPTNKFLNHWYSEHRNCKEDRIHYFRCEYGSIPYRERNCAWTAYRNQLDKPLIFQCPHNGFITGVTSEYNGHHRDRKFSFHCCHVPGYYLRTCKFTPYLNNWDKKVEYTVPWGYYLVGVHSYHHNTHQDRRWKFEICEITKSAGK